MVIIMLSINIGLTMAQAGVDSLTDDVSFFNVSNTPYSDYYTGGFNDGVSTLDKTYLPEEVGGVDGDSEDWNVLQQAKAWFKSSKLATTLGFVSDMMGQPGGFLRDIGLPNSIALAIQVLWSIMFIIVVTAFIMGR